MAGATPTINIASVPGGQIGVMEAGLPTGSQAGQASTSGGWTFTIAAADGIDDLTVGGYRAIVDGVFTAGWIAFGPGRLSVTGFDASTGGVSVTYEITSPHHSPQPGQQQRYGDFISADVVLTDRDGDRADSSLLIQIRDDEALTLSQDTATAAAGGATTGNVITGGTPDRFTADGFGSVTRASTDTSAPPVAMPERGVATVEGAYGTLTIDRWGGYTYTAKADAPAGAVDHLRYWATDGDGDEASSWLHVTIQGDAAPGGGGQTLTSPGPGSTLTGGSGNDTLNASRGSDTLTGGGGDDAFAWAAEPWSPATVKDFTLDADRLDLSKVFQAAGYAGSDPIADGRIILLSQNADTLVLFDDDGPGGDWGNYIIKLEGVANSGLTWARLSGDGTTEPPPPPPGDGQVITSPGPGSTLTGGAGADTLISSRGEDVLTGNAGADHFVFPAENWAPARITDFEDGVDRIDIRGMLDAIGYTGTDPFAAGLLTLIDDGAGGTLVLFDRDAGGPNPEWPNYVFRVEHVAPSALGPSDWIFQ